MLQSAYLLSLLLRQCSLECRNHFIQSPILQWRKQKWTANSTEQFYKTEGNGLTLLESRLEKLAAGKSQINELLAKIQQYFEEQCLRETGTAASHT